MTPEVLVPTETVARIFCGLATDLMLCESGTP